MKKILLCSLISISMTSCENYREVKKEQTATAFVLNSSPTFEGYFYKGSDSDYHYFKSKWNYARDEYFKIPIDGLKISSNYKFNKGEKELHIDPIANGNNLFAENEFYKLFALENK